MTVKGNALASLGRSEESIKCYDDKAIEIKPNFSMVILVNKTNDLLRSYSAFDTWLKRINVFSTLDIQLILTIYEKVLENNPNNAYAWTWKVTSILI